MKNIVIAAGYATRLGELTKNFPKPLLKIGENTILGRMLDDIDGIEEIDEHIIITNHRFAHIFEDWVKSNTHLTDFFLSVLSEIRFLLSNIPEAKSHYFLTQILYHFKQTLVRSLQLFMQVLRFLVR